MWKNLKTSEITKKENTKIIIYETIAVLFMFRVVREKVQVYPLYKVE